MFGSVKDSKRKFNTQGIGLGLVISKMIVEKFGGEISFKSKYKHGTQFMFSFEIDDVPSQLVHSSFIQISQHSNSLQLVHDDIESIKNMQVFRHQSVTPIIRKTQFL